MTPLLHNDRMGNRMAVPSPARAIRIGMLSTYPPTQCGLANFAASLRHSLVAAAAPEVGVVRLVDGPGGESRAEVVHELSTDGWGDNAEAAEQLDRFDVIVVQHEYGIFGGRDGDQVLDVLRRVRGPVVAVLHTVLSAPTPHQRHVLEQVAALADRVVTLTQAGRRRLLAGYDVDPQKLTVISHGAWPDGRPPEVTDPSGRPVILTWGLLGPGKGIEWGIDALPGLRILDPAPLYVVAGQTHPRVLARDGERYRESLIRRAELLGVTDMVRFEPSYLDPGRLGRLVGRADVVLLPYDSEEQVTSGVLIEAVASLTPVVSTAFPHARELLAGGAGALVPQGDPVAISAALSGILSDPAHAARMRAGAARLAPAMEWPAVAGQYLMTARTLLGRRAQVA